VKLERKPVDFLITDMTQPAFWVAALKIIGINIILSGDNAVVIALACRMLPPRERFWGMILGAGVAVLLRILFTLVVAEAMGYQWLKLIGGVLLLWVAVKLIVPENEGEEKIEAASNLWKAVRIVAVADIVMSLDNVIAIAAAAETAAMALDPAHAQSIKAVLIGFGLVTSVPMIIAGSALLMALLDRFPILVWAGAALLGWVAGDIMIKDGALARWFNPALLDQLHLPAAAAGAIFVLLIGWFIRRAHHKPALEEPLITSAGHIGDPPIKQKAKADR
jgi:YjbE family integral membrane protein